MTIGTATEADRRLKDATPLSEQEVREIMPFLGVITPAAKLRLDAELALQTIAAIQGFDKSSGRLTKWLILLTVALVALTLVIAYFTILLSTLSR